MLITAFDPIGARVTDLALDHITTDTVAELKQLLATHGVLVMPDQQVDDATFLGSGSSAP